MPRRKTIFTAGDYYHIYNRVHRKSLLFYCSDNYEYCLRLIKKNALLLNISVIAYCLMPNHYHFLLGQNGDNSISEFIKRSFDSYVQALNKQRGMRGNLFEDRFKSILIDENNYLIHLCRYIHFNPVAAGLVDAPVKWPYSNYQEWIKARNGQLVDLKFVNNMFNSPEEYIDFIHDYHELRIERKYFLD